MTLFLVIHPPTIQYILEHDIYKNIKEAAYCDADIFMGKSWE